MQKSLLKKIPTVPSLWMVEQELAERYLEHFVKQAWKVVEPKKPLVWNWHMGAVCEHLQAITEGQIRYLLINIPPRHTKSLTASVFWPCWEWGPQNLPHLRYVWSSYSDKLSTRDSLKSRRLLQSEWYQFLWGDRFSITSDQNQKTRYDNNETGYRIATSVRGVSTGEGGDRIGVDDPHNVKQAESDLIRNEALTWWDESMSTRLDDDRTGAHIIIGQRTHYADLSGHVIKKWEDGEIPELVKLILPARFEKERELNLKTLTPLDFEDPRTEEGEVLDEYRFPEPILTARERKMGAYAVAGQHQQRPAPRGGGFFKTENFVLMKNIPHIDIEEKVRYWDKAATKDGGKRTAGVLMFRMKKNKRYPRFLIADCVKGQWAPGKRELIIRQTADLDSAEFGNVLTYVEQEGGSGGKESALSTIANLEGHRCKADPVTGNKEVRAEPYADQIDIGNMGLLSRPWTREFIAEHEKAPLGEFKDQWDASAGAFNRLNAKRKEAGVWGR